MTHEPASMSPAARNRSPSDEQGRLASRKKHLWLRARMVQAIRRFFIDRDYLEVETPQLIPAPAPEVHIDAVRSGELYLQTSPELCMKRLLAAGYPRIFQLGKCFRSGERGRLHLPEFTLLEWYRAGMDYKTLMKECEALIHSVSQALGFWGVIDYQGIEINIENSWEKIPVSTAFDRFASLTVEEALDEGRFDEIMTLEIEPHLGIKRPTFLYDYPASLAALARLKISDQRFAERFEVYIGGVELANGFSELTDENEQRKRFEKERRERTSLGKEVYPMPDNFLKALQFMDQAGGVALGVDRLGMILADRSSIDDLVSFTPEEL